MPKKGGKGKKGKGKGGGGTAKAAPTVQEPVTPGHQVEDVVKGEGEGETTESLGPGTATNVPSAAPPQAAETVAASENGDSSNEVVDELRNPGTAKRFSLSEHPGDAKGRMPSSLPDRGEAAEATENTLQGAVGKTEASKAGLVGSLDAGDGEGQAVLPDTVAKESRLTAPTTAPETTIPEATATEAAAPVITDANAPVSEAPAETALPERLKEKETAAAEPTATSPSDSADLTGHPKRPYESSLFHKDEDHKPPKMAKVEDSEAAPAAAETKAADLQTEVPSKSTVQPLVVPGLGAEPTDKPVSDAEIPQKAEPAEAVAPTTAPSAAQAAASTTSPVVPSAVAAAGAGSEADAEARQKQEAKETLQAFTEGRVPAAKEPQQESEEKAQETAPVKTTPETPTKAKPTAATAAAAAAMRGKSTASPAPATEGADKTEAEPTESQPETQGQVPAEPARGEEAAAEETQQPETTGAKQSHEEAQTAVDKAQEAKTEAAKADKRKSGFWSWIKRKVKGT
ncbi:hypothetical protein Asppvi_011282 [Aspergillus pseudoviridinutans]|uniref:Uncharacterized protein n=1 Tax=Aspergillus pseudoviridinutans TaxID=1517512 RepID=A0A9P3F0S9_9EURO|nr:uncharacterized protein Asppvi_011282 [Aspergillus pseudoviridinutans]GIJ92303.1 hypothetical protein Asppvi_011282 [Aspergillus pseudoviridinutans]